MHLVKVCEEAKRLRLRTIEDEIHANLTPQEPDSTKRYTQEDTGAGGLKSGRPAGGSGDGKRTK